MVIHSKEAVEVNKTDEALTTEQEQPTPIRIEMNPETLPVLTAEAMDKIYDDAWNAHQAGKGDMDVQHLVYARLESLGIDPATIVEGAAAVRFIDTEGKNDIRAVVTNWQDFGTRVRNAELVQVEPNRETDDDSTEQQRKLELFKEEIGEAVRALRNSVPLEGVRPAMMQDLQDVVGRVVRSIYNGEQISRSSLGYLEEIVQNVRSAVVSDTPQREEARRRVLGFEGTLDEKRSDARRNFTDERSEEAGTILRKLGNITDDLRTYAGRNLSYGEDVEQSVSMIARVVTEMQSSSYGHESSAHQLRAAAQNLEEAFSRQQSGIKQIEPLLEELAKVVR